MNDPLTMLENLVPEKIRGWIIFFIALIPFAGRAWHALTTGGGIKGIWNALVFGTNTPAKPTSVAASVMNGNSGQGGFALVKMLFLSFLCSVVALWLVGCGTTPQKAAFRTVGATQIGVDAAMTEWGAYVKAFHPPATQEQAVKDAYGRYQKAMVTVCDAGAIYASTANTNAPAAASALQTAIVNANAEISDLEGLITSFGVTLH